MDKQTKEELLKSGYKRVDLAVAVGSYEAMDTAFAFNNSNIELDPDLMHIRFILCHEGVNANGDYFTKEVLQKSQFTPRNKPVDWEHGQPIVGTMLDSKYAEDSSGRGYIEAIGVVWKFIYPELSGEIKKKSATGELKLSMECYYKDANYKVGDVFYDQATAEKMGLIQYVGRDYMGEKVIRVFTDVIFGGVGVVANPADKEAVFLSVAKDLSSHGIKTDGTIEQIESISSAIAESITRTINNISDKSLDKETIDAITVAKFVKAFDKAKSSIVSRFNKNELKTKEQVVSEVRSVLNTFHTEIATISDSYYKGIASEHNEAEAKDLFFDDIQTELARNLYDHYRSFSEDLDAYLLRVSEDYFIYELIDYSKAYPDSTKLYKGFYNIEDGNVSIQFEKATEVEIVYQERASENSERSNEMPKDNEQVVATETVETEVVETQEEVETAEATEVATDEVVTVVTEEQPEVVEDAECGEDCDCEKHGKKAEASELETVIATLKAELETKTNEFDALKSNYDTLKASFDEINAVKLAEARLAELKDAGVEFSGNRLEKEVAKIKGMSDDDFADYKELLVEVAGSKAQASVEETEEEIVEEEIVVEGAKSNAGLNIEVEVKAERKPFGHLSK